MAVWDVYTLLHGKKFKIYLLGVLLVGFHSQFIILHRLSCRRNFFLATAVRRTVTQIQIKYMISYFCRSGNMFFSFRILLISNSLILHRCYLLKSIPRLDMHRLKPIRGTVYTVPQLGVLYIQYPGFNVCISGCGRK